MKSNLVLIGMPGVGKSTIGVILAKVLGYEFVDTDLILQKSQKKLLKELIIEYGPEGFIELENRIISTLEVTDSVIATGGSVVYGKDAMRNLSEHGIVIYLQLELDALRNRLNNISNRGVVFKEGQTLEELYQERCCLYEKYADVIVNENGRDIEQTLEELIARIETIKACGNGNQSNDIT